MLVTIYFPEKEVKRLKSSKSSVGRRNWLCYYPGPPVKGTLLTMVKVEFKKKREIQSKSPIYKINKSLKSLLISVLFNEPILKHFNLKTFKYESKKNPRSFLEKL